jgi:hypothetical protein
MLIIAFDESRMRDLLAVLRRQRGDAQVDHLAVDLGGDAAVLRDPPLGDVEVGEDLDPRRDRGDHGRRDDRRLLQHAVDAVADPHLLLLRLEVDVGGAALDGLGDHPLDELDDRRVLTRGAEVDGLRRQVVQRPRRALRRPLGRLLLYRLGLRRRAVPPAPARVVDAVEDEVDVARRRDGGPHLVAGHHGDVVDRQHVRWVGHGDQQRAVGGERDRHRLVALDRGRRDELCRVRVDAVLLQVEVVEAEALGDRARELDLGDRAGREQHALGGRPGGVRHLDRFVHRLALDEAEVDDDVGEHAPRAAAPGRRGDPVAPLLGGLRRCPGLCRWIHGSDVVDDGGPHGLARCRDVGPALE